MLTTAKKASYFNRIISCLKIRLIQFWGKLIKICPKNVPKICQKFTKNLPKTYQKFTKNLPKIYQKFTKNLPKIYQKFTKNLPKMYQKCTKNLPEWNERLQELLTIHEHSLKFAKIKKYLNLTIPYLSDFKILNVYVTMTASSL